MKEEYYLENILSLSKSLINLYINAEVESTNEKVKKLMHTSLENSLDMQYKLYKKMEDNKIYNVKNVKKDDVNKVYTKLTQN